MLNDIIDKDSYMKSDIYESDDKYYIEIDLPGFKKENLNTYFDNGYIVIIASKKDNGEKRNYIKRERTYGIYKRMFYVGNIDYSKINAKYKDGVLYIEVFKGEDIKNKKAIEIK